MHPPLPSGIGSGVTCDARELLHIHAGCWERRDCNLGLCCCCTTAAAQDCQSCWIDTGTGRATQRCFGRTLSEVSDRNRVCVENVLVLAVSIFEVEQQVWQALLQKSTVYKFFNVKLISCTTQQAASVITKLSCCDDRWSNVATAPTNQTSDASPSSRKAIESICFGIQYCYRTGVDEAAGLAQMGLTQHRPAGS